MTGGRDRTLNGGRARTVGPAASIISINNTSYTPPTTAYLSR
jgi:hypothetical protein